MAGMSIRAGALHAEWSSTPVRPTNAALIEGQYDLLFNRPTLLPGMSKLGPELFELLNVSSESGIDHPSSMACANRTPASLL
jgi:hypothetical protein